MSFAVLAELPLGAYRGLAADGGFDPMPTPARLHAALLCAAAAGTRAEPNGDLLAPSSEDAAALRWLEEHPPDGVVLPRRKELRVPTVAFRKEGTLKKEGSSSGPRDKVKRRPFTGLVAVEGPFGWTWNEPPPDEVRASLEALVSDVSHLGNSESPARLRLGDAEPTLTRDPDADLFTGSGIDLEVPTEGRTDALASAYVDQQRRPPLLNADRYVTSEEPLPPAPAKQGLAPARYVAPDEPQEVGPWQLVHLLRVSARPPSPEQVVSWAVAVHRSLCARVDDAPPVLTGVYAAGVARPANRVTVHFLHGVEAASAQLDPSALWLLVAMPAAVDPLDAARIASALTRFDRVTVGGRTHRVRYDSIRSGVRFWPRDTATVGRPAWRTATPFVPDTRAPRRRNWTLADAVLLSVALVMRDQLHAPGRGAERYVALRDAAAARGATVHATRRVTVGNLGRYVHHVSPGTVVQPLHVELGTGDLVGGRALLALGQSRHLGGGLLIPVGDAQS